jgi:hypothetical protein
MARATEPIFPDPRGRTITMRRFCNIIDQEVERFDGLNDLNFRRSIASTEKG